MLQNHNHTYPIQILQYRNINKIVSIFNQKIFTVLLVLFTRVEFKNNSNIN